MRPEQRVAAKVIAKHGLTFPADVQSFASQLADIEFDELPTKCDAVVLTARPKHPKPLIILNKNNPPTRLRFTIAHELGHMFIPWHMGTFACHVNGRIQLTDRLYASTEAESNRFASELLLPSDWLSGLVASGMSPAQMTRFARSAAGVSSAACALALIQALPAGYLFAMTDGAGCVQIAVSSPGSALHPPENGDLIDVDEYSQRCTLYETVICPLDHVLHWWRYVGVSQKAVLSDTRTSSEILRAIVTSVVHTETQATQMTQRINGIIGSANGSRKPKTLNELLDVLHQTFTGRSGFAPITSHVDFDTFLHKRANDIISRQ